MSETTLDCSFCGKTQHEVRKLIAGPTVFICDECVGLCNDIVGEDKIEAAVRRVFADELKSLSRIPGKIAELRASIADGTEPQESN